jgi:hypothetical protein
MPVIQLKTDIFAKSGDYLLIRDGDVIVLNKGDLKEIERLKKSGIKPDYSDPDGPMKKLEERRNALFLMIKKKPSRVGYLLANMEGHYGVNNKSRYLILNDIKYLMDHKLIKVLKKEGKENVYSVIPSTKKKG